MIKFIKLISNEVAPSTVISYLSALKFYHSRNSHDWAPIRNDPLVKEILKTIEANHKHEPVKQKMHITRNHLDQIRRSLNIKEPDDLLFWVVALTAFYELAQLGELLPDRKSEKLKTPCLKAIKFEKVNQATFATIQLAKTKNHKSTIRTILVINSTNDRLCPIRLLKTYIIRRTSPN